MGQKLVTDSLGGYFTIEKLSEEMRYVAQPLMKFRQFVNIHQSLGANKGSTVFFPKVSNVGTAGGTLVETSTMPETEYTVSRGTMTVTEYGNSVPWTGKLEELAQFDVENITTRTLRNDMAKVLDKAAGDQFVANSVKYVCLTGSTGTLTTNGTPGGTAAYELNAYHIRQIVKQMKKTNVPKYDGENYICIASVNALDGIMADTAASGWVEASKYGDPERLFRGEVGKFGGVRFVEETNYLINALGGTAGTNGSFGEAVFFGGDAVVEAIALPEEIRVKVPTDYGRSQGCAWYGILGFKVMWTYAADTEDHIVHVSSVGNT